MKASTPSAELVSRMKKRGFTHIESGQSKDGALKGAYIKELHVFTIPRFPDAIGVYSVARQEAGVAWMTCDPEEIEHTPESFETFRRKWAIKLGEKKPLE